MTTDAWQEFDYVVKHSSDWVQIVGAAKDYAKKLNPEHDGPVDHQVSAILADRIASRNKVPLPYWEGRARGAEAAARDLEQAVRALEQKRVELNVIIGERDAEIERQSEELHKALAHKSILLQAAHVVCSELDTQYPNLRTVHEAADIAIRQAGSPT